MNLLGIFSHNSAQNIFLHFPLYALCRIPYCLVTLHTAVYQLHWMLSEDNDPSINQISVHAWIHFHESYHWICLNRLLDLKSFVYSFCHHNKVMCLLDISYVLLKYYINNLAHLIVAYNTTPIQYRYKCMVYGWE